MCKWRFFQNILIAFWFQIDLASIFYVVVYIQNFSFHQNDALSYLRRAGILWERRVRKSLNSMCTELEVTLQGQLRTGAEREELLNKWDELSNYQIGIQIHMIHC